MNESKPMSLDGLMVELATLRSRDAELTALLVGSRFYVLLVPDDAGPAVTEAYDTPEAVAAALVPRVGKPLAVYVFRGEQWLLSRPPVRALVSPSRAHVYPIGPAPSTADADVSGRLD